MNEDGTAQMLFKSVLVGLVALAAGAGTAVVVTQLRGGSDASASDDFVITGTTVTGSTTPTTLEPGATTPTSQGSAPDGSTPSGSVPESTDGTTAESTVPGGEPSATSVPADSTRLNVVATGEVLLQEPLWEQAKYNGAGAAETKKKYDYTPMFEQIAPMVGDADFAVCHLETPIAPENQEFTGYPEYGVQPNIVETFRDVGYDSCSTASNHALDKGAEGIDRTVEVFKYQKIESRGTARAPSEADPTVMEVNGVKLSHLAYTYGFNGESVPDGEEWRANEIDPEKINDDAAKAKSLGADVVIVSLHWGTEGQHQVTDKQRELASTITAAGDIDLVIGHHAHVIQPIEQINGTWVLYGTGDLLSDLPNELPDGQQWPAATQDGAIFEVPIDVGANGDVIVQRPLVIPTWVDKENGYVIVPVQQAIASGDYSGATLTALEESLQRTADVVGPYFAQDPQQAAPVDSLDPDVPGNTGEVSLA